MKRIVIIHTERTFATDQEWEVYKDNAIKNNLGLLNAKEVKILEKNGKTKIDDGEVWTEITLEKIEN